MKPILYLIRGIPGSGKSTFAKTLGLNHHFEADMYFIRNGEYLFDGSQIKRAHEWCQNSTREAMKTREDIVVSNTFTTRKELAPYIAMAEENFYEVIETIMEGNYGSIHNVPESVMIAMKNRFEV